MYNNPQRGVHFPHMMGKYSIVCVVGAVAAVIGACRLDSVHPLERSEANLGLSLALRSSTIEEADEVAGIVRVLPDAEVRRLFDEAEDEEF